ncbi:hypothetical protein SCG7109_AA_00530 [Chlamydiales bacterium SCGC AG-110-M15]|nr:hypothetical protein SCG7109_AA_00530 [Chlamydiales bacterium SCGC AG-110-M15]
MGEEYMSETYKQKVRGMSLKWKMTLMSMCVSGLSLILMSLVMISYESIAIREVSDKHIETLSNVVAFHAGSILASGESDDLGLVLEAMEADKNVLSATIQTPNGDSFAWYRDEIIDGNGEEVFQEALTKPLSHEGEALGTLSLQTANSDFQARLWRYVLVIGNIFLLATFVSYFAAMRLQRLVSKPIVDAIKIAQETAGTDVLKCAETSSQDELMLLHCLLEQIKSRKPVFDEEHAELRAFTRALNEMLLVVNTDGEIQMANSSSEKILEYESGELKGKNIQSLFNQKQKWKTVVGYTEMLADGTLVKDEISLTTKNGKNISASLSASGIMRDDELTGLIMILQDLRGRKSLESQLVQAQKLEAVGQLAAGVAHEINTPMQYIGDNTEFLSTSFDGLLTLLKKYEKLEKEVKESPKNFEAVLNEVEKCHKDVDADYLMEEMPEAITQTKQGVAHVVKIVQSLKAFSHQGGKDRQLIDLNKAVENVVTVAKNEWKYVSDLTTELDPNLEMVPCFSRELNQVMLNIIVNAAHAIEEKKGKDGPKGNIKIETKQIDGEVEVRISDDGPGIPQSVQDKVFDPFFTTKDIGKGTGQGLSLAHSVINDQHKGQLDFETSSEGTTFIIRLPLVSDVGVDDEHGEEVVT